MNHLSNDNSNRNNRRINPEHRPPASKKSSSSSMPSATGSSQHHQNANSSSNSSSSGKDKHKVYSRISSKFVKCAWEHMDRGDVEVAPEVFSKLSDEVTNKLWELANNIKTYSRHCGGYVSSDLVNEVLKDSNCPPAIGCHDAPWDKFEIDRPYYFQADELVDLSEEYLKEVKEEENGKLVLTSLWISTHPNCSHLSSFATKLCNAVFSGSADSFQLAIEIAENEPTISCILIFIFKEIVTRLTTDYSSTLLDKSLRFLNACIYNPYTRDSNVDMELITMAELLVSILLGPPRWNCEKVENTENLKCPIKLKNIKKLEENDDDDVSSDSSEDTEQSFSGKMMNGNDGVKTEFATQIVPSNYGIANDIIMNIDQFNQDTVMQQNTNNSANGILSEGNPNDIPDIEDPELANFKNECEELFAIMEEIQNSSQTTNTFDSFNIKKEKIDSDEIAEGGFSFNNASLLINSTDHNNIKRENIIRDYGIKLENTGQGMVPENSNSFASQFKTDGAGQQNYRKAYTRMCKRKMIEAVGKTIGLMASKWGYFEKIVLLMVKGRLKIFYARAKQRKLNEVSYQWLMRCIYALWAVGEEGFIHLFNCTNRIDAHLVPAWIETHLNIGATYLRGSDYHNVYNWLYQICGDTLLPNMVFYARYINRINQKHALARRPGTFKITPKLQLKVIAKPFKVPVNHYNSFFANCNTQSSYSMDRKRKMNFKFPGCRPLPNTKNKKSSSVKQEKIEPKLDKMILFQSNIVIGKRKIMKTLSNATRPNKLIHVCYYNL